MFANFKSRLSIPRTPPIIQASLTHPLYYPIRPTSVSFRSGSFAQKRISMRTHTSHRNVPGCRCPPTTSKARMPAHAVQTSSVVVDAVRVSGVSSPWVVLVLANPSLCWKRKMRGTSPQQLSATHVQQIAPQLVVSTQRLNIWPHVRISTQTTQSCAVARQTKRGRLITSLHTISVPTCRH